MLFCTKIWTPKSYVNSLFIIPCFIVFFVFCILHLFHFSSACKPKGKCNEDWLTDCSNHWDHTHLSRNVIISLPACMLQYFYLAIDCHPYTYPPLLLLFDTTLRDPLLSQVISVSSRNPDLGDHCWTVSNCECPRGVNSSDQIVFDVCDTNAGWPRGRMELWQRATEGKKCRIWMADFGAEHPLFHAHGASGK